MLECFPGLFGFTVVMHPRVCSFWCGGEGGGGALQLLQISNLFSVLLDSFLMADLFQFLLTIFFMKKCWVSCHFEMLSFILIMYYFFYYIYINLYLCVCRYKQHKTDFQVLPTVRPIDLPCKLKKCRCSTFQYVPMNGSQSVRCRCKHFSEDHDEGDGHACVKCKPW